MKQKNFSADAAELARRRILRSGAWAGLGLAAGGLSRAYASADAEDADFLQSEGTGHPVRVDAEQREDWDVVVIGSGAAGLAAALEARRAGARVVILEKMGSIGGNSVISEGLVGVPGTPMQAALGIHDSPELFAADLLAAGYVNHPGKVRVLAQKALETFEWTRDELGVRWWEDRLEYELGQSVRRTAVIREAKGGGLVYPLYERARALGVVIRLRTKALHLLEAERLGERRVAAVLAEDASSGTRIVFHARRGVVLASGGFSSDIELRQMQNWRLSARVGTATQPGSTGEMLREAARIGAWLLHLEYIHCIPDASPDEKGWGTTWKFSRYCAATQGIWAVRQTGQRFVNETGGNVDKTNAIFDLLNAGLEPVAISDARAVRHPQSVIFGTSDVEALVARGFVSRYPTLEALAEGRRIPLAALQATVARYNDALRSGRERDEMGRRISPIAEPMEEGPWFASPMLAKVLMCSGGIAADDCARVLSVVDDRPIPGLYAAGEVTGGLHGIAFVGSAGLLDALVFGRIAGQCAAKSL